jgi:class 3 adenylate cyclase
MAELPMGTLTLLFSDMEGSTHLLRSAFAQHHGHEVDTQGDAFFVVFTRASDAVAVQRALLLMPGHQASRCASALVCIPASQP